MNKSFIILSICLLFLLSLFVFQKINLTNIDLGRHIVNGKLFLNAQNFDISRDALVHTNFFSYTNPDFPFINHHLGSGILFYIIFLILGFGGLSLLYGGIILFSTFLLFYIWRNKIPIFILFPIILFLIPLIGERTEVRPEVFGYLFISIIITLLLLYDSDRIQKKWLYTIPVLSLFFVNMHIYFIFYPFILGLFLFENLIRKNFIKVKNLSIVLSLSILALFVNPYGFKGIIYPFIIFKKYGYLVAENQSISFLINYGVRNPNFFWWKIATIFLILTSLFIFLKHRNKFPIALFLISSTFAILSFLGIRHFSLYGLSLIPLFLNYSYILYTKTEDTQKLEKHIIRSIGISVFMLIFILFFFRTNLPFYTTFGIGLKENVNNSMNFYKTQDITGPIFSNYDIGSYLIFHLDEKEKVFIDNRPEAYPVSFLQNEYIPMQNDDTVWDKEQNKWQFNVIYFYRLDMTPWAQEFLIKRISDPLWAPVFVDDYTIIFLNRNEKNASIIKQYELPKSMFSIK